MFKQEFVVLMQETMMLEDFLIVGFLLLDLMINGSLGMVERLGFMVNGWKMNLDLFCLGKKCQTMNTR